MHVFRLFPLVIRRVCFFFFFQAEDGIRDYKVTGVQTCALPISRRDKGEMRKLLQAKGLSCPAFAACTTEKKVAEFAQTHPWPLVIKTPRGAAKIGRASCRERV